MSDSSPSTQGGSCPHGGMEQDARHASIFEDFIEPEIAEDATRPEMSSEQFDEIERDALLRIAEARLRATEESHAATGRIDLEVVGRLAQMLCPIVDDALAGEGYSGSTIRAFALEVARGIAENGVIAKLAVSEREHSPRFSFRIDNGLPS